MIYCRFSSDNWSCDIYCYKGGSGFVTHVAGDRAFNDSGAKSCADRLESLRTLGYRVPQYAIDTLREEAAESQCADCNGTRKVGGEPCGACCPTDDGPGKDEK